MARRTRKPKKKTIDLIPKVDWAPKYHNVENIHELVGPWDVPVHQWPQQDSDFLAWARENVGLEAYNPMLLPVVQTPMMEICQRPAWMYDPEWFPWPITTDIPDELQEYLYEEG